MFKELKENTKKKNCEKPFYDLADLKKHFTNFPNYTKC